MTDHADCARIATAAGEVLLVLRDAARHDRVPASAVGDTADALSDRLILDALAATHPEDAVLSEEAVDDKRRLSASRVWIVDPLDGTREFGEYDRTDWAVHVALWSGGRLAAGAVALPALGITLSTSDPPQPRPHLGGAPRVVVSRTRPPRETEPIRAALGGELIQMGSAGAKAMAVVRGEADVYAHSGGQYEWDSAAPVAVAAAAGLHVSRLDGSRLAYNRPDPYLPDLLICRPELADTVLNAVGGA